MGMSVYSGICRQYSMQLFLKQVDHLFSMLHMDFNGPCFFTVLRLFY